eukprot:284815314_2
MEFRRRSPLGRTLARGCSKMVERHSRQTRRMLKIKLAFNFLLMRGRLLPALKRFSKPVNFEHNNSLVIPSALLRDARPPSVLPRAAQIIVGNYGNSTPGALLDALLQNLAPERPPPLQSGELHRRQEALQWLGVLIQQTRHFGPPGREVVARLMEHLPDWKNDTSAERGDAYQIDRDTFVSMVRTATGIAGSESGDWAKDKSVLARCIYPGKMLMIL